MNKSIALSAPSANFAPMGARITVADGPVKQRYVKDILRLGRFVHPVKKWVLDVTDQTMDAYENTFNKMKANGVGVKLTKDHAQNKSDSTLGEAQEVFRDGEWLKAIFEVTGEKNIEHVEKNKDVSVEIDPTLTDSRENIYHDCITAISVVQKPIIPGQKGFQRIAAGVDEDRPTYFFSIGEPDMKNLFAAIAKLTGTDAATLTEDTAIAAVNGLGGKVVALEGDKTDLTKKLSLAGETHTPDKKYLSLAAKSIQTEIDSTKGVLSDAGRAALTKELIGDRAAGNFSKLLLSADSEEEGAEMAERICKIIRDNPAVAKGPKTVVQERKELSADGGEPPQPITAERLKELFGATTTGQEILRVAAGAK